MRNGSSCGVTKLRQAGSDGFRARSARGPAVRLRGRCLSRSSLGRGRGFTRGEGATLHSRWPLQRAGSAPGRSNRVRRRRRDGRVGAGTRPLRLLAPLSRALFCFLARFSNQHNRSQRFTVSVGDPRYPVRTTGLAAYLRRISRSRLFCHARSYSIRTLRISLRKTSDSPKILIALRKAVPYNPKV